MICTILRQFFQNFETICNPSLYGVFVLCETMCHRVKRIIFLNSYISFIQHCRGASLWAPVNLHHPLKQHRRVRRFPTNRCTILRYILKAVPYNYMLKLSIYIKKSAIGRISSITINYPLSTIN